MAYLQQIKQCGDLRRLPQDADAELAKEIRAFLVEKVSKTGGHLASNLGIVELTLALHRCFDFTNDKIIWDVGHQAYVHKILSGRKDAFDTLRTRGGLAGFPKRSESDTDSYDSGHSSTSVSAGLGLVSARDLKHENHAVISVIGDGAATGGLFFEALNNAGKLDTNFIIILNDNEMSISKNASGLSSYLSSVRTATSYHNLKENVKERLRKLPKVGEPIVESIGSVKEGVKQLVLSEMLFENLGLTYLGPIDGHNERQLIRALREARKMNKAVLLHVITQKGKGYVPAERRPDQFHGVGPFNPRTGKIRTAADKSWTQVFSDALVKEGADNEKLVAITAAMADGTGLKCFAAHYPKRFFDVGIAEAHAVSFAAGQALGGLLPVVAVYSTFLQRAYDQLIEDICLQNLHVIFAIDRAGLVGADGETHQGLFDLSYLCSMPNMTVLSPKNAAELTDMLHFAIRECKGPVAIRYGRGAASRAFEGARQALAYGQSEMLAEGTQATVFAEGMCAEAAADAVVMLQEEGLSVSLINARFIKPLDSEALLGAAKKGPLLFVEEGLRAGGFGERATAFLSERCPGVPTKILAVEDEFVPQGTQAELRKAYGLDAEGIAAQLKKLIS